MTRITTSPNERETGASRMVSPHRATASPAATRLGAVRLQVADLARSLEWYRRVLGLELLDGERRRRAARPRAARS